MYRLICKKDDIKIKFEDLPDNVQDEFFDNFIPLKETRHANVYSVEYANKKIMKDFNKCAFYFQAVKVVKKYNLKNNVIIK